jgi:hypothetical protein
MGRYTRWNCCVYSWAITDKSRIYAPGDLILMLQMYHIDNRVYLIVKKFNLLLLLLPYP